MQRLSTSDKGFKKLLNSLPERPGVYRFLDANEKIIYVGKSKNLQKRIRTYFLKSKGRHKKLVSLVEDITFLEIVVTTNELEAFLHEQHQIKEHKPKYNVQYKDDKGYPWIKVETTKEFPSVTSFLGKKSGEGLYFGPFPSSIAVREVLKLLQKIFKLRNCSESYFKHRTRPCLQFEIGRCSAPCVESISRKDYAKEVENAIMLLQGKADYLVEDFYYLMDKNSENKTFERAAFYRDKISALREVQRDQSIAGFSKERDAISLCRAYGASRIGVTKVRGGWITGHNNFKVEEENFVDLNLSDFISTHYSEEEDCPEIILVEKNLENKKVIEKLLSLKHEKSIKVLTHPTGKDRGLLQICRSNTKLSLKRNIPIKRDLSDVFNLLQRRLRLDKPIEKIECIDISHLSGSNAIGACISYNLEGKNKSLYRLYDVSKKNAGNDLGSIQEVIERHFRKKRKDLGQLPDLIIIDGGQNHLKSTKKSLESLDFNDVQAIAISKGARRKADKDSIHLNDGSSLSINKSSIEDLLIQEMRDEAHRFSITNQRKKMYKQAYKSSLDLIPGIGKKRKKALIRYFGSVDQILKAGIHDLVKVEGIGKETAVSIYDYLR